MPISRTDQLYALVKSLSKAEKRHFKIYAQRVTDGEDLLYVQLFDVLDKQKTLDERQLSAKIDKRKLPNMKRHLYSQILISLRLLQRSKQAPIQVRELIDFAHILYGKGLYTQSLKILNRADQLALKIGDDILRLQIIEFKKVVESRHITRTGTGVVVDLVAESTTLLDRINVNLALSNLRIQSHSWYIANGHVKNDTEAQELRAFFTDIFPRIDLTQLNQVDKTYYYQSMVWFHFSLCEWPEVLHYARRWVDVVEHSITDVNRDTNELMRGYHYVLTALYNIDDADGYEAVLEELEDYRHKHYSRFNTNSKVISFLYVHNGRLNKYILTQDYMQGLQIIPKTLERIARYRASLDDHRILVFYYKIARIYLMAGQPEGAITYLRKITHTELRNLREDIQVYARLAFLMAHYDAGNHDLMPYLIHEVNTGISKLSQESILQTEIPSFMDKLVKLPIGDRRDYMRHFYGRMQDLNSDIYEQRGFLYLDILSWLRAKI